MRDDLYTINIYIHTKTNKLQGKNLTHSSNHENTLNQYFTFNDLKI